MKGLVFLLLMTFSASFGQAYLMDMEVLSCDSEVVHKDIERVRWSILGDSVCFRYSDKSMCYKRWNLNGKSTKEEVLTRNKVEEFKKELHGINNYKDVFMLVSDKSDKRYLIRIYIHEGLMIWINQLLPKTNPVFYQFTMVPNNFKN
jgi:hypothetical protein